ncbi:hypothetical protein B0H13DRAFT_1855497 [Mycena leptocephala]|nr:hypothetical protein B0H13DRAFT_1855497 [Mycena leptocephala]
MGVRDAHQESMDCLTGRPSLNREATMNQLFRTSLRDLLGNRVRFVFCAVMGVRDAHQESMDRLTGPALGICWATIDGCPGRPLGEQRGIDKTSLRDLLGNHVGFVLCAVMGVRDAHQESMDCLTSVPVLSSLWTSLRDLLGNHVRFVLCAVMGVRDAHQESMDHLTGVTSLRDLLGNHVGFVPCAVMGVRDAHQESLEVLTSVVHRARLPHQRATETENDSHPKPVSFLAAYGASNSGQAGTVLCGSTVGGG